MITARGITYAYVPGRPVLRGVGFALAPREAVFVLGANGSGKTTLIECLCGVRAPQAGVVEVGGHSLFELSPRQRARLIGYVPQFQEVVFTFTAWDMVLLGRAPHVGWLRAPSREDSEAAAQALNLLGIWDLRARPITTLSGGERRLVLIARGLAQGGRYLFLDEPDANLDPANQHRVLHMVQSLVREGLGLVVSSHNPNNALLYGSRVLVLANGKTLSEGPPASALSAETLALAYGIPFQVVGDDHGPRAVLPKAA